MSAIELDDYDRSILKDCPFTIRQSARPNANEIARMKRVKRLWTHGYVGGEVNQDGKTLIVTIRNPGRAAIGRVALPEQTL